VTHPTGRHKKGCDQILTEMRAWLWHDLADQIRADLPNPVHVDNLVLRIRTIGEHIGAPTAWTDVPPDVLAWHPFVDNQPAVGLYPQTIDWEQVPTTGVMHAPGPTWQLRLARLGEPPEDLGALDA